MAIGTPPNTWPGPSVDPIVGVGPIGTGAHRTRSGRLVDRTGTFYIDRGITPGTQAAAQGGPVDITRLIPGPIPGTATNKPEVMDAILGGQRITPVPHLPQTVSGSFMFRPPTSVKPPVYPGGAPTATNDPTAPVAPPVYTPPPPLIPKDFLKNLSKQVLAMSNIDYSKLSKVAQAQARAAVAAKVAELHAVQSQYLSQGRQNMRDLFALGSVNPEPGLGSFLTSNANTAAQTIGALAQAFAPAGAPSIGAAQQAAQQVGGAPVTATGINLANLASQPGLPGPVAQSIGVSQGLIPASAIESQGLTSATEAGMLPYLLQGQANQEGQLQMAQAQARARGVQPSIGAALSQLPSIYQSNFTSLANAARTSSNQNISNLLRLAGLGISAAKANAVAVGKTTKPITVGSPGTGGVFQEDPTTGTWSLIPGTRVKKPAAGSGLSATAQSSLWSKLDDFVTKNAASQYTNPSTSSGVTRQYRTSQGLSPDALWRRALEKYPLLLKSPAARQLLLAKIEDAYGTSYTVGKDGHLHTYVGLGPGQAQQAPPDAGGVVNIG